MSIRPSDDRRRGPRRRRSGPIRSSVESLEDRTLLAGPGTTPSFLTGPNPGRPLDIALGYLAQNGAPYGVSAGDLARVSVTNQYTDAHNGVTHIYLSQGFNGLAVDNARINVNIGPQGQVINVGGGFLPGLGDRPSADRPPAPRLSALDALLAIADDLGVAPTGPADVKSSGRGVDQSQTLVVPGVSVQDVPAHLEYYATPGGERLAWDFVVWVAEPRFQVYNAVADAETGDLLKAYTWVDHLDDGSRYNVYALPNGTPNYGPRVVLDSPSDAVASPFGWHDTNGAAGAEFTDTRGNNVNAYEDTFGTFPANGTATRARPDGGASLNFDFPIDLASDPLTYSNAAVTNLFYVNNVLHDVHFKYGFDEASGNFQVRNYSGVPGGGDPVFAVEAFGANRGFFNNAFMFTPPDGQSPTMAMFLWTLSNPRRSGGLDAEVIVHEFGHGVSNRLTGGPSNANALDAQQSGSMGEGWSDWWSLMFTQGAATPTRTTVRPIGNYVLNFPQDGPGIRRFPYSFDMAVDPLTLGDYNSDPEVHDAGEIWCAALWDLNVLLVEKYGYDPNIAQGYQGEGSAGNLLALQLVMDALKLQPANPRFTDARDAILLADQLLTGGANQYQIWTAFARRGLGVNANCGTDADSLTVVEDFNLPNILFVQNNKLTGTENQALGAQPVLVGSFFDPAGQGPVGDYTVSINWGDGSPTDTNVTVAPNLQGGFDVLGNHTYREGGSYSVTINASRTGTSGSNSRSAVIADLPMSVQQPGNTLGGEEGTDIAGALGTFSDALDPDPHAAGEYTVTIDWGDGSGPMPAAVTALGGNEFRVDGTHNYNNRGTYTYTVRITSPGGGTASFTGTVNVTPFQIVGDLLLPLTPGPVEGQLFFGDVARFQARPLAQPSDFVASITWQDGVTTPALVRRDLTAAGFFFIAGSHRYDREGLYPISVTLVDRGDPVNLPLSGQVSVADAPINASPRSIVRVEGVPFDGVVATFVDTNPFGQLSDYSSVIDWGDGTPTESGTIVRNGANLEVRAAHTFAKFGSYAVVVTIRGGSTSQAVVTTPATISDAPITATPAAPLQLVEGQPFSGVVATFVDANTQFGEPGDFTARIRWGDGVTTDGVVTGSGGAFSVVGTHTYLFGTYAIQVTIASAVPGGSGAVVATTAEVADAPLDVQAIGPIHASEGLLFSGVVARFTDANPASLLTDNSATIDWGDGTPASAGIIAIDPVHGGYTVSGDHVYGVGTFTVTVTVHGNGGSVSSDTTQAVVPNAPISVTNATLTGLIEGVRFSGVVATIADENPMASATDYVATITWDDGSQANGLIVADPGGGFVVRGNRTFPQGVRTFSVSVRDVRGNVTVVGSPPGRAFVGDAPIVDPLGAGTLTVAEGSPLVATLATFRDANPQGRPADWTAVVDWGDGSPAESGVVARGLGGTFLVTGTHPFRVGTSLVTVVITSASDPANTATVTTSVVVPNAPLTSAGVPFTVRQGQAFSGVVATLTDGNPSQPAGAYSVTIDWGDGTLEPGRLAARGDGRFDVLGTRPHTYRGVGAFNVTVTILDGQTNADGSPGRTAATAVATVENAPLSSTFPGFAATEKSPFSGVVATFADANPLGRPGDYAATIDWGDGTPATPGRLVPRAGGGYQVVGDHTFAQAGDRNVVVVIRDPDGGQTVAAGRVSVADRIVPVVGVMAAFSDSGPSNTDGITNVRTPVFAGLAEAGDTVTVYAQRSDLASPAPVGQTVAGTDGRWSLAIGPLLDGVYTVFASAADADGRPSSRLVPLQVSPGGGPLVIDTVAPIVTGARLNPRNGQVVLTVQDSLTGFDEAGLNNPANYGLGLAGRRGVTPLGLRGLVVSPGLFSTPRTVVLNTGTRIRSGGVVVSINGAGITDLAGNALDGGFFNPPGRPGSSYLAQIVTDGNVSSGPILPQSGGLFPRSTRARSRLFARG